MLVENPYIDAMALFDREQLIKIGGYDTELYKLGWFGWEDYDLWLRIAEAKFHVSFLPNVLCLYRHHERAMSITTNLFERELVAHLIEKYRSLIETYPPKRRILGVNRSVFEQTTKTSSHAANGGRSYGAVKVSSSHDCANGVPANQIGDAIAPRTPQVRQALIPSVTHLTRSQRVRVKDSDCSKGPAPKHQTSVGG